MHQHHTSTQLNLTFSVIQSTQPRTTIIQSKKQNLKTSKQENQRIP